MKPPEDEYSLPRYKVRDRIYFLKRCEQQLQDWDPEAIPHGMLANHWRRLSEGINRALQIQNCRQTIAFLENYWRALSENSSGDNLSERVGKVFQGHYQEMVGDQSWRLSIIDGAINDITLPGFVSISRLWGNFCRDREFRYEGDWYYIDRRHIRRMQEAEWFAIGRGDSTYAAAMSSHIDNFCRFIPSAGGSCFAIYADWLEEVGYPSNDGRLTFLRRLCCRSARGYHDH